MAKWKHNNKEINVEDMSTDHLVNAIILTNDVLKKRFSFNKTIETLVENRNNLEKELMLRMEEIEEMNRIEFVEIHLAKLFEIIGDRKAVENVLNKTLPKPKAKPKAKSTPKKQIA